MKMSDAEVGDIWRRAHVWGASGADPVIDLIRKLVEERARHYIKAVHNDPLTSALRDFGIDSETWE